MFAHQSRNSVNDILWPHYLESARGYSETSRKELDGDVPWLWNAIMLKE